MNEKETDQFFVDRSITCCCCCYLQCLVPCSIHVTYSSMPPPSYLKDSVPPKEDIHIKMTKLDIKLTTNVIYHVRDAMSMLTGEFFSLLPIKLVTVDG